MSGIAIVRPPCSNFAQGLTSGSMGAPDLGRARAQHREYVRALERLGMRVVALDADDAYPDSTFVEDTAVMAPGGAILARPGAPSRRGEVDGIRDVLARLAPRLRAIEPPGTLEGGDVCAAGTHYLIGVSARTNVEGARQLAAFLAEDGCTSESVGLQDAALLHLKSGLWWLGGMRVAVVEALADHPALERFERLVVDREEELGANGVRIGDTALVPSGCPRLERRLTALGLAVIAVEMSEFQKMDGGVSCLSLRIETPAAQRGR